MMKSPQHLPVNQNKLESVGEPLWCFSHSCHNTQERRAVGKHQIQPTDRQTPVTADHPPHSRAAD